MGNPWETLVPAIGEACTGVHCHHDHMLWIVTTTHRLHSWDPTQALPGLSQDALQDVFHVFDSPHQVAGLLSDIPHT